MPSDENKFSPPSPVEPMLASPVASTVPIADNSAFDAHARAHFEGLIGTTVLERYLIEKELGRGGIGIVYLARDRKLMNKPVVIKVLLDKSLRSEWVVRKFEQEKEALARVDHPGIVGILDGGELPDGKPFLVMQYVDGVTLRSALRPEGIGLRRAACVIKQSGSALSAAHKKGIFHRDLKPENIMLQVLGDSEEQVKIIDFGIAKVKNSQVAPSTVLSMLSGTVLYMSPEQLRGEKVTAASDIYALGVIAYEIVTGRRPFNPETAFQLAEMQRAGVQVRPQALRPALPQDAETVILKALSFNPRERYQSAREFGDALELALVGNEETPACELYAEDSTKNPVPHGPQKSSPKRIPKRIPTFAIIAVAALVLVSIFGFVLWSKLSRADEPRTPARQAEPAPPTSERTLSYWLTVQKMRDGQPYQEPFDSSGQEVFETGYMFRLNMQSPQPGYLYLLNEGLAAGGANSFTMLYPTPVRGQGSARLEANHKLETGWNTFSGQTGTELCWMVWAAEPVPELEAAREAAFKSDKGALSSPALIQRVRAFLESQAARKPEIDKDRDKRRTTVRGTGDVLVNLIELEHR